MKIIQYQESYSSLMFRKKLKPFLLGMGFSGFLLLLIISWFFIPWLRHHNLLVLGLFVAWVIFVKPVVDRISDDLHNFKYGKEGEQTVLNMLSETLNDNYVYIQNYTIPNTRIGDIDGLLIGPKGVIILEVKNYVGIFRISGGDMERKLRGDIYKIYRRSPFKQIIRQKEYLIKFLKEKSVDIPILPVVVLVEGRIEVIKGETGAFIAEVNKLTNHIFKLNQIPNWSTELSDKIFTALNLK